MYDGLSFTRLRAQFCVLKPFKLPFYTGSTFHGILGHSLAEVHFGLKKEQCTKCPSRSQCRYSALYEYFFNSPSDHPFIKDYCESIRKNQKNFPQPFIIEPPSGGVYLEGEHLYLIITLIGKAIEHLPFMTCALFLMNKYKFGGVENCISLESITDDLSPDDSLIYDGKIDNFIGHAMVYNFNKVKESLLSILKTEQYVNKIQIRFLSPFRYKQENRLGKPIDFKIFISRIFDRLNLLSVHSPLDTPIDSKSYIADSNSIEVRQSNIQWFDWKRYSCRQDEYMKFGGYIGDIKFTGELNPFLPYIKMAEYLHVGKQTSFGLGKFKMMIL
ncbi:MAG: CRISPR system precrRNA processing endoribonuclease RAMP protein Cas6 [Desulfobacterales bacterium]|nr:CRISPR system precrRNA processing endoribonuclease RAMP protein Cas6 [Desulfobacterales bacterium]